MLLEFELVDLRCFLWNQWRLCFFFVPLTVSVLVRLVVFVFLVVVVVVWLVFEFVFCAKAMLPRLKTKMSARVILSLFLKVLFSLGGLLLKIWAGHLKAAKAHASTAKYDVSLEYLGSYLNH